MCRLRGVIDQLNLVNFPYLAVLLWIFRMARLLKKSNVFIIIITVWIGYSSKEFYYIICALDKQVKH